MGVKKEGKLRRKRSRMLSAFLLPEALLFFVVGWSLVCIGSMSGKRSSKMDDRQALMNDPERYRPRRVN